MAIRIFHWAAWPAGHPINTMPERVPLVRVMLNSINSTRPPGYPSLSVGSDSIAGVAQRFATWVEYEQSINPDHTDFFFIPQNVNVDTSGVVKPPLQSPDDTLDTVTYPQLVTPRQHWFNSNGRTQAAAYWTDVVAEIKAELDRRELTANVAWLYCNVENAPSTDRSLHWSESTDPADVRGWWTAAQADARYGSQQVVPGLTAEQWYASVGSPAFDATRGIFTASNDAFRAAIKGGITPRVRDHCLNVGVYEQVRDGWPSAKCGNQSSVGDTVAHSSAPIPSRGGLGMELVVPSLFADFSVVHLYPPGYLLSSYQQAGETDDDTYLRWAEGVLDAAQTAKAQIGGDYIVAMLCPGETNATSGYTMTSPVFEQAMRLAIARGFEDLFLFNGAVTNVNDTYSSVRDIIEETQIGVSGVATLDILDVLAPMTPFGFGTALETPGFRIYEMQFGTEIAAASSGTRSLNAAALMLGEGMHTIGISRVNAFGCESDIVQRTIEVDAEGDVFDPLTLPTELRAVPLAGGMVRLTWHAVNRGLFTDPAEFEVRDTAGVMPPEASEDGEIGVIDLLTPMPPFSFGGEGGGESSGIIATVAFRAAAYRVDIGPFGNRQTLRLQIRSSDGVVDGRRSAWVDFPVVVADAEGPIVPRRIAELAPAPCSY